MADDLIDRLYEAAFVPQAWPEVLTALATRFSSREAGMSLVSGDQARWIATERCAAFVGEVAAGTPLETLYHSSLRNSRIAKLGQSGFQRVHDVLTPAELEGDDYQGFLRASGLEWQAMTLVRLPDGASASFSLERSAGAAPYTPGEIGRLDRWRAHLGRAALMAARLGLERAEATVAALAAIGLPAAVFSRAGRVLSANALFQAREHLFLPMAFGGMAIADADADRLFQEALAAGRATREPVARSIPIRPGEGRAAAVVHVLPLRGSARDIFSGADVLVAMTEVAAGAGVPDARLLAALFDLSPAEARLAAALAGGRSLKEAASGMNVGFGSARTYLARIFAKTGTNQQSQLVALLKSARIPAVQAEEPGR